MVEEEAGADDGTIYLDSDSEDEENGHNGRPVTDHHLLSQESSSSFSPSSHIPGHSNSNNNVEKGIAAVAVGFDSQAQDDEDLMDVGVNDEPDREGLGLGLGPSHNSIDEPEAQQLAPGDAEQEQHLGHGNNDMGTDVACDVDDEAVDPR